MILVTGASGFIGGHLLDALVNKYGSEKIVALTSAPTTKCRFLLHDGYNFNDQFFRLEGFEDIETVIHAGAFIPKSQEDSNDLEKCNSNIHSTYSLLKADLAGLKNFIFLSTVDVYGYDDPITEESPETPVSLYGSSKIYCERLISAWAFSKKKNYRILRIGHVYGPGEESFQKIIPLTIQRLLKGDTIRVYNEGKTIRTFIYITDVVNAVMSAIPPVDHETMVNVVGNEQISIIELINKLMNIAGIHTGVEFIKSSSKAVDLIFDNKKMREVLYSPKVKLDEGLLKEWIYMRELEK